MKLTDGLFYRTVSGGAALLPLSPTTCLLEETQAAAAKYQREIFSTCSLNFGGQRTHVYTPLLKAESCLLIRSVYMLGKHIQWQTIKISSSGSAGREVVLYLVSGWFCQIWNMLVQGLLGPQSIQWENFILSCQVVLLVWLTWLIISSTATIIITRDGEAESSFLEVWRRKKTH